MGLFNSFFKKKATSAQVGYGLFELCITAGKAQRPIYGEIRNSMGIELDEYGLKVEAREILIINMWSITKCLGGSKFDESIRCMQDYYFEGYHGVNREEAQKVLLKRYEQYESLFDHKNGRHFMLATQMLTNMYNNGELTEDFLDGRACVKVILFFSDIMVEAAKYVNKFRICD